VKTLKLTGLKISKKHTIWYNLIMGFFAAGILGLVAGILVNYLSDVLPSQRKFAQPVCTKCGVSYGWVEYLLLKPCRGCANKRNLRPYLTLFVGIALSILIWFYPPAHLGYWLGLLVLTYFGLIIVIDIENHLILHKVSLVGALIGLLAGSIRYNLLTAFLGGLAGFIIMLLFYWFGILFGRYRARKLGRDDGQEAFGFGDVTLSAVLGLMLGWPLVIYGLIIGILLGGVFSLVLVLFLLATRRYETMTVFTAYGPYLVMGAGILIFIPQILTVLSGT
jgi:leader peptidase (prepilin peptidase)/N-methyltransferase